MRTNIDIDDKLMRQAMKASGASTKKGAVETALRQMVQIKAQGSIRKLRGKIAWRGHDDDWFAADDETLKQQREVNQAAQPDFLKSNDPIKQRELAGSQGHR
jgi:Arc/MetJ family transcription regulator